MCEAKLARPSDGAQALSPNLPGEAPPGPPGGPDVCRPRSGSVADRDASGGPSVLLDKRSTFVPDAKGREFEAAYARAMADEREKWVRRTKSQEGSRAQYARRRVAALKRPRLDRRAKCRTEKRPVACACGVRAVDVKCGDRLLCAHCQKLAAARLRERLIPSFEARKAECRGRWRGQLFTDMFTLTCRHSGSPSDDRACIERGWRAVRKLLHKRVGRFPYMLVWEVTPGRDGLGHVHAHAVAVLPWVSWAALRRAYFVATKGRGERFRITSSSTTSSARAANYVCKYVSKGVQLSDFAPVLAANVAAAFYGKRWHTPSHRFYEPKRVGCPDCGWVFWLADRADLERDSANGLGEGNRRQLDAVPFPVRARVPDKPG